jgi:hypothetical protein
MMKLDSEVISPKNFRLEKYNIRDKDLLVEKITNLITISRLMEYDLLIKQLYKDKYKKEDCQFHIFIGNKDGGHEIRLFIYGSEIKKMSYVGLTKEGWEKFFEDFSALITIHMPPKSFYLELYESEHMSHLIELISKYI